MILSCFNLLAALVALVTAERQDANLINDMSQSLLPKDDLTQMFHLITIRELAYLTLVELQYVLERQPKLKCAYSKVSIITFTEVGIQCTLLCQCLWT